MKIRRIMAAAAAVILTASAAAQSKLQVYDETVNPLFQLEDAIDNADEHGTFVLAQLGGNWCKWCIRLAKFIDADPELKEIVDKNYEYIHVNYNPHDTEADNKKEATAEMLSRLGNPTRFGFPVLIVLDGEGKVVHIQDSALLESGDGYDKEKVKRFLTSWAPSAVKN